MASMAFTAMAVHAGEAADIPFELELPLGSGEAAPMATLGVVQRAADPGPYALLRTREEIESEKSVLGLRMDLPVQKHWKVGAEALRSHREDLTEAATALRLSLDGEWHGIGVAAKLEQVDGDFRDPGGANATEGQRAELQLTRREKDWHLSALAKVDGPAGDASSSEGSRSDYRVDAGRVLPGSLRSTVKVAHASSAVRDSTDMTLALRRRFDGVDIGVEHRNARVERSGTATASQRTGLEVRFGSGAWSWVTGTALEERTPAAGPVTEVQSWFLAPQWTGPHDLKLRLRVGLDREDPPGLAEIQRVVGKGSLIWKLRERQHDADLRFDLSLSHVERATSDDLLDHRATLKLSYRFWS